jgi:hypothetical protein
VPLAPDLARRRGRDDGLPDVILDVALSELPVSEGRAEGTSDTIAIVVYLRVSHAAVGSLCPVCTENVIRVDDVRIA